MKQFISTLLFLLLVGGLTNGQVAVIVHQSVSEDSITKPQLRDLYTGDIRIWHDKKPVFVYNLKARGEVSKIFYSFKKCKFKTVDH